MNYLAHSLLSNNEHGLLVGNFIADHLRGNDFSAYPEKIIEGIQLHRKIDAFTDAHPKFRESKRLFYNGFEKYSGILVDIYFDHLLAKNFSAYSSAELQQHCEFVYKVYRSHQKLLPSGSAGFLEYVVKNNVFYKYSSISGIERVLYHLSQRIGHQVYLNESVKIFQSEQERLTNNFQSFFADAMLLFGPQRSS